MEPLVKQFFDPSEWITFRNDGQTIRTLNKAFGLNVVQTGITCFRHEESPSKKIIASLNLTNGSWNIISDWGDHAIHAYDVKPRIGIRTFRSKYVGRVDRTREGISFTDPMFAKNLYTVWDDPSTAPFMMEDGTVFVQDPDRFMQDLAVRFLRAPLPNPHSVKAMSAPTHPIQSPENIEKFNRLATDAGLVPVIESPEGRWFVV